MLGQLCFVDEFELEELDEDEDVDDFAEGLLVAACAIAAPPPTRAPDSVSAIRARVSLCRMIAHLLWWSSGGSQPPEHEGIRGAVEEPTVSRRPRTSGAR